MDALWDTTLASRLHPQGATLDHVVDRLATGAPVKIAAPAVLEIAYGYERMAASDVRYRALLRWFTRVLASDAFEVVALDGRAALVAGRLRGARPHPPAKRRDQRSKTMRQAAWLLDIQIASVAYAAGLDVATENRSDFLELSSSLAELFPQAPVLGVVAGPDFADG